ncbi:MAG: PilZ domain-containing protein [Halomonas sp.]
MQFLQARQTESNATESDETSTAIGSGPGALMFEPGPQTRIRRAPVQAIASLTVGERKIFGRVANISPGGCLFKTGATLEVGEFVDMQITVLGDDNRAVVTVRGVVRRSASGEDRPEYGVEFIAVDETDHDSLQWLYAQAMR